MIFPSIRAISSLAFILPFLSLLAVETKAQRITYDGCRDINGYKVASLSNQAINDIAQASLLNGNPVIYYNPNVLAGTRPQTRLFFYAHECGHHALGHVLSSLRVGQEQEADCWGIRKLKESHMLGDHDIALIQADIAQFGQGDWTHLPGPQRAINLRTCLADDDSGSPPTDPDPPKPKGHWEYTACIHPLHPNGDAIPCQHVCWNAYGQRFPCHQADVVPCSHSAHPNGDRVWVSD